MKHLFPAVIASAATLLFSVGASAADNMANMPGMATGKTAAPASTTHAATGIVKQVDITNGKVIIAHEAIKTLEWPAMTMGFTVKDKLLFSKLTVGKKVDFQVVKQGDDYVVVNAR
jgi:Cu(I)/Ag(I) efflux system protein CusF